MTPITRLTSSLGTRDDYVAHGEAAKPTNPNGLVLEAWAEGYMIGSLIILTCITISNMRRSVLLHKLILVELIFGYWQGVFILFNPPIYAWWLSVAAIFLNTSWSLHNVIAWMKLRPFLPKWWSRFFIGTIILVQPYWVVEIYANFAYFHNINDIFLKTRPWEALCRDPWWIAAAIILLYNIKSKYEMTAWQIARISPRFLVLLIAMLLSIAFIILDVLSVTGVFASALPVGINPFWKLSFVFKCLTDAVVLDDFKTALDRLRAFKISRLGSFCIDNTDDRMEAHRADVLKANGWHDPPDGDPELGLAAPYPSLDSADAAGRASGTKRQSTNVDHVEHSGFVSMARSASRDRDLEENEIQTIDTATADRYTNHARVPPTYATSPPRLSGPKHDSNWGDEYSAAIKELAVHDAPGSSEKEP